MSRASVKFFCVILNPIRTVILEIKCDNSLYNAMAAALTYSLNNLKLARLGLSVFTRRSFRKLFMGDNAIALATTIILNDVINVHLFFFLQSWFKKFIFGTNMSNFQGLINF